MRDVRDIVEIGGVPAGDSGGPAGVRGGGGAGGGARGERDERAGPAGRAFLGVWFRCCHVYGRMYKSADGSAYSGRCPRCGAEVGARVGEGGTSRRFFEAG